MVTIEQTNMAADTTMTRPWKLDIAAGDPVVCRPKDTEARRHPLNAPLAMMVLCHAAT